jgi:hypothetical protein
VRHEVVRRNKPSKGTPCSPPSRFRRVTVQTGKKMKKGKAKEGAREGAWLDRKEAGCLWPL